MDADSLAPAVEAEIKTALALPDGERFAALEHLRQELLDYSRHVAQVRADAARELRAQGATINAVARALGVSKTRAVQILGDRPLPAAERA